MCALGMLGRAGSSEGPQSSRRCHGEQHQPPGNGRVSQHALDESRHDEQHAEQNEVDHHEAHGGRAEVVIPEQGQVGQGRLGPGVDDEAHNECGDP